MESTAESMSRSGRSRWWGLGSWTFVISRTDASRNHGNWLNGTNNSRSPTNSQNPWRETLVTSAGEVLGPGAADFDFRSARSISVPRRPAEDAHRHLSQTAGQGAFCREEVSGAGLLTVTHVINTHGHPDHTNGNDKAAELTATPVAAFASPRWSVRTLVSATSRSSRSAAYDSSSFTCRGTALTTWWSTNRPGGS